MIHDAQILEYPITIVRKLIAYCLLFLVDIALFRLHAELDHITQKLRHQNR